MKDHVIAAIYILRATRISNKFLIDSNMQSLGSGHSGRWKLVELLLLLMLVLLLMLNHNNVYKG